jgi:methylthioribose-1-phosphate isomerase
MIVNNRNYRTIWLKDNDDKVVQVIDQRFLPHQFVIEDLSSIEMILMAIKDMHIRGAGLIGAAAGYGMYIAALEAEKDEFFDSKIQDAAGRLQATRPTAVNLQFAVKRQLNSISAGRDNMEKVQIAKKIAMEIADEDAGFGLNIGLYGVRIIEEISKKKSGAVVNILTHCNAGWLAFVDYGSALAPIYEAFKRKINLHVWVDETRPRNQGASLTAWELMNQGVPHTIIADNTGGHLMQHKMVDLVITGADRVTRSGDVANKIGTYLKALAAYDNHIPFYVAIPSSTIDWTISNGIEEIPIEQRGEEEVKYIQGLYKGELIKILLTPEKSPAANYGFDVTPARLITGLISERGICKASFEGLSNLFPEFMVNHG